MSGPDRMAFPDFKAMLQRGQVPHVPVDERGRVVACPGAILGPAPEDWASMGRERVETALDDWNGHHDLGRNATRYVRSTGMIRLECTQEVLQVREYLYALCARCTAEERRANEEGRMRAPAVDDGKRRGWGPRS